MAHAFAASGGLEGRVLGGRYRIGELLGAGGMGRVYRAVHVELGRACAVKVIRPPDTGLGIDWRAARAHFRGEALAGARLDHPNVLRVLDFGREPEDGLHYLVTEHVDGLDLARVLAREGALPAERVARIGRGICAALQHAHDRGVVHRDLKPENVCLVRREADDGALVEEIKILDFGSALIAGEDDADRGSFGNVLGTPAYMSAEQASGAEVDARSDLYALGVLLFELCTGRLPFERDTAVALAAAHASAAPPSPSAFVPSLDPRLSALILACLRKRPAERPASAREVRDALAPLLSPARVEARRSPAAGKPDPRDAPFSWAPYAGWAKRVLALAGVAGAVGLWVRICAEHVVPPSTGEAFSTRLDHHDPALFETRPAMAHLRPQRQVRDAGADAALEAGAGPTEPAVRAAWDPDPEAPLLADDAPPFEAEP